MMQRQMSREECASRAFGSSIGNLFLGFFGMAWIVIGLMATGKNNPSGIMISPEKTNSLLLAGLGCFLVALVGTSVYIMRRTYGYLDRSEANCASRKKINRRFGLVNLVQWGMIFAVVYALPRLGLGSLVVPAIMLIVGIHFFPLARLFNARVHYVTGSVMVIWAILYPILFSASQGDPIGAVGAGAILWISATFACCRALRLLQKMRSYVFRGTAI